MLKREKSESRNLRANFLFISYMLVLGIFLVRLFSIQVLSHGEYTAQAQEQYWNLSILPSLRGDIITSDNFVLAGTQTHYLMFAEPQKVENTFETAHRLSEILTEIELKKNNESVKEKLTEEELKTLREDIFKQKYDLILGNLNSDLYWVVIDRNISPVDKEQIELKQIKGIGFEEEPIRYYPEKDMAAHVLGFVAFNEKGEKQGYYGIEGALNGDLKGKSGRILEEKDALGNPILVGGYKKSDPIKGRDIVLTINRAVQHIVEKKLEEGVENYDAKSGSIIVMDPFTGEIVAMANYPSYTPDDFNYSEDEQSLTADGEVPHRPKYTRINQAISETYEPGSVLKPLTVSAAIELGKVSPNTTFEDNGPVGYSDYVIDNWDGKHHGTQTITQLLEKSNNIGAAWVGHLVGAKDLSFFLKEFGLGSITNLELEGEDTGVIRDYKTWTDIDLATVSFGQGISATPLQVLNVFNVIANGGYFIQPKIVSQIIDEGEVIKMPTREVKRVISAETSSTMVDMLESAARSGEANYFIIKNYDISGKTGTAQIPVDGKYDPKKTNATFAGFLTNSKKFSMIVKLEEPRTSTYASETAVPLWMDIAEELVKYYGIAPDRSIE